VQCSFFTNAAPVVRTFFAKALLVVWRLDLLAQQTPPKSSEITARLEVHQDRGVIMQGLIGKDNKDVNGNGLTTMPWMVTQGVVDKQNKLYLLSLDQSVFVSTSGL
jgi:hypothetical protein